MITNDYYSQEGHGPYELIDIGDLDLEEGRKIKGCKLAVATHGKLNDARDNAILVPSRALQTGPNGQFVYVVKDDQTVDLRRVSVTRSEGDNAVLGEGGVKAGEKVVVRGALRLAPGAKVIVSDGAPSS